jgi:hypothetical protein
MATGSTDTRLEIRDFPGEGSPDHLLPRLSEDNVRFFEALADGRLALQRCLDCARFRFPVAPVCPHCHCDRSDWLPLTGRGAVHSWIRYQRPYLEEFASLMPYSVVSVQLEENVRIFGRLADRGVEPRIGMPVQTIVERWPGGRCIHAFIAR